MKNQFIWLLIFLNLIFSISYVSAEIDGILKVSTIKDVFYTNEYINLTDPPAYERGYLFINLNSFEPKDSSLDLFSLDDGRIDTININKEFDEWLDYDFNYENVIGISVSGSVEIYDVNGYARIIALDSDGKEHLIFQSDNFYLKGRHEFDNFCFETCKLKKINVVSLIIELKNSSLYMGDVFVKKSRWLPVFQFQVDGDKAQKQDAMIKFLNNRNKEIGLRWLAGETSVSKLSYSEKRALFGEGDDIEVPNLNGFEYYKGGIFEIPFEERSNYTSLGMDSFELGSFPDKFDWRDVHGENWNTRVKNQLYCGSCWDFGALGAVEAYINLYFNQHLDIDLSEQDILSCGSAGSCGGGSSFLALKYIKTKGVVDEMCFPYEARDLNCSLKCSDWEGRIWKIGDYKQITLNLDSIKKSIIEKGVTSASYTDWNHAMALSGYENDSANPENTIWIYKNSWGADWGENGYVELSIPNSQLYKISPNSIEGNVIYPASQSLNISCVDKDEDNYCWWGLTDTRPKSCPENCLDGKDCDDSNNSIGDCGLFFFRPKSQIINNGSDSMTGYLVMSLYKINKTSNESRFFKEIIRDTQKRTINPGESLALDIIWNDKHVKEKKGFYEVYASFVDENNNVIVTDSGALENKWEFEIKINPDFRGNLQIATSYLNYDLDSKIELTNVSKSICYELPGISVCTYNPESRIINYGNIPIEGYLDLKILKNVSGNWEIYRTIVSDVYYRIENNYDSLNLSKIWNEKDIKISEVGGYRVYGVLKDENGEVIETVFAKLEGYFDFFVIDCIDNDRDGYLNESCGGSDCDDNNNTINPEAGEICGDKVDNNCNGLVDETCYYYVWIKVTTIKDVFNLNEPINITFDSREGDIWPVIRQVSLILNRLKFNISGYLFMEIQKNVSNNWESYIVGINETDTRIIEPYILLYLSPIWDPLNISIPEKGNYRIYASFKNITPAVISEDGLDIPEIVENSWVFRVTGECVDKDNDGYDNCDIGELGDDGKQIDCNDNDDEVNPGATEICDGKDNDCDNFIDEGCYLDEDINEDGKIDIQDLVSVALKIGSSDCNEGNNWCKRSDVSRDGLVNIQDLVRVALDI